MPLFIYVTRDIHINHVRCGHAGAVPDPKAQHQLYAEEVSRFHYIAKDCLENYIRVLEYLTYMAIKITNAKF